MYTEAEAKTKWCPLARAVRGDGVSAFNRGTDMKPDVATFCIASDCMSWRWELTKEPLPKGSNPGLAHGLAYALQPTTFERGFCGAFGTSSGAPKAGAA
jgi:hypothetical protein